jgi:hypothetical protein
MRPLRQHISPSEEHPRGKHGPVVIGMEWRGCDLHSSADYQGEAIAGIMLQLKFAKHQSWSYEVLHSPVVGPAMVKGRVVFDLWPKESSNDGCCASVSRTRSSQLVKNPDGLSCPLHGMVPTVASNAHNATTSLLRITATPDDGASGQTSLVF